jgi:hypothetical protein
MKSINLDSYQAELKDLLEKAPMETKRIYVLDSSGEVDKVLDFKEVQELFDYLWAELQTVPLVYVVKTKKIGRVELRANKLSALYELQNGKIVMREFNSGTSVSKSGLYSRLQ